MNVRLFPFSVTRVLLGGFYLIATAAKVHQLSFFAPLRFGPLESRALSIAVICAEATFAIWLLFGGYEKLTRYVAVAIQGVMLCISLAMLYDGSWQCSCLGVLTPAKPIMPLLNGTLLLAILLSRCRPNSVSRPIRMQPQWLAPIAVALVAVCLQLPKPGNVVPTQQHDSQTFSAALKSSWRDVLVAHRYVLLDYEELVGHEFPLLEDVDIGEQLSKGEWEVFLKRQDCGVCNALLPRFLSLSTEQTQLAVVELDPSTVHLKTHRGVENGRVIIPDGETLVAKAAVIRLSDGVVEYANTDLESAIDELLVAARIRTLLRPPTNMR